MSFCSTPSTVDHGAMPPSYYTLLQLVDIRPNVSTNSLPASARPEHSYRQRLSTLLSPAPGLWSRDTPFGQRAARCQCVTSYTSTTFTHRQLRGDMRKIRGSRHRRSRRIRSRPYHPLRYHPLSLPPRSGIVTVRSRSPRGQRNLVHLAHHTGGELRGITRPRACGYTLDSEHAPPGGRLPYVSGP